MATHLPHSNDEQVYVTVSGIDNGSFSLPERYYVSPADPLATRTVPSLAFLIRHPAHLENRPRDDRSTEDRLLFDLGLRGRAIDYTSAQQKHLATRQPYDLSSTVKQQLEDNGISSADIDTVLLSHVHWDHTGDPGDFPQAEFLLGAGGRRVLCEGLSGMGSHQHFDPDLLPSERTRELPETDSDQWRPIGPFKHALDLFKDGSVYVLDLPGHLPGHVGLLCRVASQRWICLCGDAYHDLRLRTGECSIATWESVDESGSRSTLCIHLDQETAAATIDQLERLARTNDTEVIAAHDSTWLDENRHRLFPKAL